MTLPPTERRLALIRDDGTTAPPLPLPPGPPLPGTEDWEPYRDCDNLRGHVANALQVAVLAEHMTDGDRRLALRDMVSRLYAALEMCDELSETLAVSIMILPAKSPGRR